MSRQAGVPATQSLQIPPRAPHAVTLAPLVQLPPAQQPLHGPALHAPPGTHVELDVSQIAPAGQSAGAVQPQPPATQMQALDWHAAEAPQAWQSAPPVPQAMSRLPGWQAPLASQQPPGQVAALQVQAPPWHTWPPTQV